MSSRNKKRPNILWVSFEDTNPRYGCYGDPVARTPTLDRLAEEGCRWPLCFSTAPVCAPARAAVITGMYSTSIGTHHMRTSHYRTLAPGLPTPYAACPPHYVKCFSEYLRAEGYYCTNNEKTDYQFDPPSTAWDECSDTAHWRNRPDKDQPFFAVFNPCNTHESAMWPENTPDITFDPNDMILPPYYPDTPKVREAMARTYTQIERSDAYFGELLKQLEEDGLAENTIVFHWSDHGPMPRGKRWPYDTGLHVPMIVRWPGGLEPGSVSNRLVSTIDLGPTVLSLTGIEIPHHMQGRAFLGPASAKPRKYIYATRDRYDEDYDMIRAVRDRRFKYIRHYRPDLPYLIWVPYRNRHPIMQEMYRLHLEDKLEGPQTLMFQNKRPVEELYDTEADPWEINNLAGDPAYREKIEELRMALDAWMDDVGDMGEIPEAEMVRQWYPDGERPKTETPAPIPISSDGWGEKPAMEDCALTGPAQIQLYCTTQGASMAYTLDDGDDARWLLYTGPIRLPEGKTTLRMRAVRIGYLESDERSVTFTVC